MIFSCLVFKMINVRKLAHIKNKTGFLYNSQFQITVYAAAGDITE